MYRYQVVLKIVLQDGPNKTKIIQFSDNLFVKYLVIHVVKLILEFESRQIYKIWRNMIFYSKIFTQNIIENIPQKKPTKHIFWTYNIHQF